ARYRALFTLIVAAPQNGHRNTFAYESPKAFNPEKESPSRMDTDLKPLISPQRLVPDTVTQSDTFGRFTAEPFERGFGNTIGNSLRRVLLSSIQGAAATSVRFEGI